MDTLPEGFTYVPGSTLIDGQPGPDPVINGQVLTWTIPGLTQGQEVSVEFTSVPAADTKPGRYCILAQSMGSYSSTTPPAVWDIESGQVQCCTVVTNRKGAGCCITVEEWPQGIYHRPEGPVSFIEPYFDTQQSMFTVYAALKLWKNNPPEKGTMPEFMKERLINYARSNIEEFYFGSGLGIANDNGDLKLAFAGAYPEKNKKKKDRWFRKNVDETMTASQIGFELLALNETLNVEERADYKERIKRLIEEKLAFVAKYADELPHGWELKEKDGKKDENAASKEQDFDIDKTDEDATLYDRASLYLSMVELSKAGYQQAGVVADALRKQMKTIDDNGFDGTNLRQEFVFILALLKNGQADQAKAKIAQFELLYKKELDNEKTATEKDEDTEDTSKKLLSNLHDYSLAATVDKLAGGSMHDTLFKRMREIYYLKDTGVYADKQPDLTFKLGMNSMAPLVLSFDTSDVEKQNEYATILYRMFDEIGLFLKKRNLAVGKPLYSLLKNYPFAEPMLPVLSFTKANRTIAPVFSRDAIIHSTQLKPLGEAQIPNEYSRILSPVYETDISNIASVSFGLQYMGQLLSNDPQRVIKEEGRAIMERGHRYVDSLLNGGAGLTVRGFTVLPYDTIAVKGPKQGEHNLEPIDGGIDYSTAVLADYLTAEKLYIDAKGKHADDVSMVFLIQQEVVAQFKELGYVPARFKFYIDQNLGVDIECSPEKASKLTVAKLFHVFRQGNVSKFLKSALKKSEGKLQVEDLIFISSAPELTKYFKKELEEIVDYKDSKITYNAADIIGRRLLGQTDGIEDSLQNLLKNWDKEAVLPKSDKIDTIEKGIIYNHQPRHFLLYLLAVKDSKEFRFKRTLNFFSYMLENEWGVKWDDSFISFPSASYRVFKEQPKERVEPGDIVNFKVEVDNTCPEGFGSAFDLNGLFLKATFTPPLVYLNTELVEGLTVTDDFKWRYVGFPEGSKLEYVYQAFVPYDYDDKFVNGNIYVSGSQGYESHGPDSASGDKCDALYQARRLDFLPFVELPGVVFEDRNVNGTKEAGEPGIANIMFKDTRGRMFRSDAEGRFTVLAGDQHEGVQMELRSVPAQYVVNGSPTKLVNRRYKGEVFFALIPCDTVKGFVYVDANGNGQFDDGETQPGGVVLKAKDKEVLTRGGKYIFRNIPTMWIQWIEIAKTQPFYKGDVTQLKITKQATK